MSYRGTSWVHPDGKIVQVVTRVPGEAEVGTDETGPIGIVHRMGGAHRVWCARRLDGSWIPDTEHACAARAFKNRAEAADALVDDFS